MHRNAIITSVAIVLSIAGGTMFLLNNSKDKDARQSATAPQSNTENIQSPANSMGAYVDYAPGVIENTRGTKLLFFHASWCPQCRMLEADIKKSGVPDGITIIKVDYDANQSLRKKYGVTLQTTLVKVDDNGNLVKKYVAYDSPTLSAVKTNLL